MDVKISTKYQIVIPKAVRRQLGLKPGQMVHVSKVTGNHITISKPLTADEYIGKYAGILTDTPWQKAGIDPADWLRQQRDSDR